MSDLLGTPFCFKYHRQPVCSFSEVLVIGGKKTKRKNKYILTDKYEKNNVKLDFSAGYIRFG